MAKQQKQTLPQVDFSRFMGLTSRQLKNLERLGMPCHSAGGQKLYPFPEAVQWYVNFKVEAARS